MNNNRIITVLIVLLIGAVLIGVTRYNYYKSTIQELKETLSSSERKLVELEDLTLANDQVTENTLSGLNSQIGNYELLINKWIKNEFSHDIYQDLILTSYDVEAIVHTDDSSFPLPKNGKIVVDSDVVELEINIIKPPILVNKELNLIFHQYDRFMDDIIYDEAEEAIVDENSIRIKYSNLVYGDKINVFISNELNQLLELNDSDIHIDITNDLSKSEDYLPQNIEKKVFSGGLLNRGFTHKFDYSSGNTWTIDLVEAEGDLTIKIENDDALKVNYEYDSELKVTEISRDGNSFTSFERVVLPSIIKLGESWQDQSLVATITAIDYPVETALGILDAIEVTYRAENGYISYVNYYVKEIGLVRRNYRYTDDVLIEIEYNE